MDSKATTTTIAEIMDSCGTELHDMIVRALKELEEVHQFPAPPPPSPSSSQKIEYFDPINLDEGEMAAFQPPLLEMVATSFPEEMELPQRSPNFSPCPTPPFRAYSPILKHSTPNSSSSSTSLLRRLVVEEECPFSPIKRYDDDFFQSPPQYLRRPNAPSPPRSPEKTYMYDPWRMVYYEVHSEDVLIGKIKEEEEEEKKSHKRRNLASEEEEMVVVKAKRRLFN